MALMILITCKASKQKLRGLRLIFRFNASPCPLLQRSPFGQRRGFLEKTEVKVLSFGEDLGEATTNQRISSIWNEEK